MITPILRTAFLLSSFITLPAGAGSHNVNVVTTSQICQSVISTVIDKDVQTIKTEFVEGNTAHVIYTRPEDGRQWRYRCNIKGNTVAWASGEETWFEAETNSHITFSTLRDRLYIAEKFNDGDVNSRAFSLADNAP